MGAAALRSSLNNRPVYGPSSPLGDAGSHVPVDVEGLANVLMAHHALDDLDVLTLLLEDGPGAMPERMKRHVGSAYCSGNRGENPGSEVGVIQGSPFRGGEH